MPHFSIIIGIYNQAATLPILLESLQQQTFQDFEVHFCDDGSTDDSADLIQRFMSIVNIATHCRYFYHRQENKGMRLARNVNQGIKAARGKYCVFVMADSFLEQDYLEILNEYVAPDRLVCGVRVQVAEVGGVMQGVDMDWRIKKNLVPQFPSVILSCPWLCLTGNGLTIPTAGLRELGGWDEALEGYGGDDNEIVARFFFKGYLCWSVPDLRLYHHWHKSTESNMKNSDYVIQRIREYER